MNVAGLKLSLLPSLPELFFAALLLWVFAAGQGWTALLADGDTGLHIRTGERILDERRVPSSDSFSFETDSRPWFAWEWLSDVIFASLFRAAGLKAVVLFCGTALAAALSVVLRHALWRGAPPMIAVGVALLAAGASTVHFLARPHVLTFFLLAVSAWLIDADRRNATRWIWVLVPLTVLWTNLHGGFLAVFTLLGAALLEEVLAGNPLSSRAAKLGLISGACAAGTLANPYGWHLHVHLIEYLGSHFIRDYVGEFQSPSFRSEGMFQFELLVIAGSASLVHWIVRRKFYEALLITAWAHFALTSARHVPLFAVVSAPFVSAALAAAWMRIAALPAKSWITVAGAVFDDINAVWAVWARGTSLLIPAIVAAVSAWTPPSAWPRDFPAVKFPVSMVERHRTLLESSPRQVRVLSQDQWSDYLIFRLAPRVEVYMDGRSDYFATWRGSDYRRLMSGESQSMEILRRERIAFALLPIDWPLATILRSAPGWKLVDSDSLAALFQRVPN